MIRLERVTKVYDKPAVRDISFAIKQGEIVALLGPNGAGKTTLLRMISSLAQCSDGSIWIKGKSVGRDNLEIKRIIGVMPQSLNLENELSVYENLRLHAKLFSLNRKESEEKINDLLALSDLQEKKNARVRSLSGGMKRKLLLIRAILHDPEILLLDEPTVGLDVPYRKTVWKLIKLMRDRGKTILVTTHYLEEAEQLCDSIALLNRGELLYYGTKDELFSQTGPHAVQKDEDTASLHCTEEEALIEASKERHYRYRKATLEDIFVHLIKDRK